MICSIHALFTVALSASVKASMIRFLSSSNFFWSITRSFRSGVSNRGMMGSSFAESQRFGAMYRPLLTLKIKSRPPTNRNNSGDFRVILSCLEDNVSVIRALSD